MPTYLTPGIYIEEISTGPRPIEAVGTSTAAFIGVAPNPEARPHEAVAINNWSQFVKESFPQSRAPSFCACVPKGGSFPLTMSKRSRTANRL